MISIKLMVCASNVIRDGDTNLLSIFNVLESLAGAAFPFLVQQFAAAVVLERDPSVDPPEHVGVFTLRLGDQLLAQGEARVNFEDKRRTRQVLRINGLVIPAPGALELRFTMGALTQAYTVDIDRMTPAQLEFLGMTPAHAEGTSQAANAPTGGST